MRLLRTLTLVYAAVLASALVASLLAIWTYLQRIAGALGKVLASMTAVRDATGPLGEYLEPLDAAIHDSAEELAKAEEGLALADERLAELIGAYRSAESARS